MAQGPAPAQEPATAAGALALVQEPEQAPARVEQALAQVQEPVAAPGALAARTPGPFISAFRKMAHASAWVIFLWPEVVTMSRRQLLKVCIRRL